MAGEGDVTMELVEAEVSGPCVHTRNMSSMYRLYMSGSSCCVEKNAVSRWCMKKHARVGAMGVPIATPVI